MIHEEMKMRAMKFAALTLFTLFLLRHSNRARKHKH